jgi:UDP-2,3-diacylglucosamine hydrolase
MKHSSAAFISDLHLDAATPGALAAFELFCGETAPRFDALYILGDLFEVYVGDDDLSDPLNVRIVEALRRVARTGTKLRFMHGNRDFLVGALFARATGAVLLEDPVVHTIAGQRVMLSHGDAWCTDDVDYQRFRAQARSPAWQTAVLAQSLDARKTLALSLRGQSEHAKRNKPENITDVNLQAVLASAAAGKAQLLVHGHTHRSAAHHHALSASSQHRPALPRFVLSDWEFDGEGAPRGNALVIDSNGPRFVAVSAAT